MRRATKSRLFLKKFALILSSVLFLGSVEVSAYTATFESRLSLHKQDFSQAVDTADELFAETGEERDGESLSDTFVVAGDIPLSGPCFAQEQIALTVLTLKSSLVNSLQNTRAPPAL